LFITSVEGNLLRLTKAPGFIDTPMLRASVWAVMFRCFFPDDPDGPTDISQLICAVLASEKADFMIAQTISMNGRLYLGSA
jgi:hypothetical protein